MSISLHELIENLARVTKEGFDRVHEEMGKMITRQEFRQELDKVNNRLDRIEFFMTGHDRRIEILEDVTRQLKTKLS